MAPVKEPEIETWRILLFGSGGAEMLLFRSPAGLRVPELRVPRGQRVPPLLNEEANRLWNVETVCVSSLDVSCDRSAGDAKYYVLELHRPQQWEHLVPGAVELSSLDRDCFADPTDFAAIQKAARPGQGGRGNGSCGPFADLGAFGRISSWTEEQLRPLGLHWDGHFCQLQAAPSFSLIRFSTNRGAVWFKAVGEPNLREFPVTLMLAPLFPRYVPHPLAAQTAWNGWLAEESQGQELSSSSASADWCRAAESLAELQVASIPVMYHILGAGARDVRSRLLLDRLSPFFSDMEVIMEQQAKTPPCKPSCQEIRAVREQVGEALDRLERTGIPDTLNHLDLNPSNIFVSGSQCTFLDWAEAAVGNPFLSLEYLREHFVRTSPGDKEGERLLLDAYLGRWTSLLPSMALETALHLAPLAAAFAYATVLWDGRTSEDHANLDGFLRSLVRRMASESERIAERRTGQLCMGRSGHAG